MAPNGGIIGPRAFLGASAVCLVRLGVGSIQAGSAWILLPAFRSG